MHRKLSPASGMLILLAALIAGAGAAALKRKRKVSWVCRRI